MLVTARRLCVFAALLWLCPGCPSGSDSAPLDAGDAYSPPSDVVGSDAVAPLPDVAVGHDAGPDAVADAGPDAPPGLPTDTDEGPDADTAADATPDSVGEPDAAPVCDPTPPAPPTPTGPSTWSPPPASGVDTLELAAYATLRDAALADPGTHFVATWSHVDQQYIVDGGPIDSRSQLRFRRVWMADGGVTWEVDAGDPAAIFPSTDPAVWATYDELLGGFENPNGVQLESWGYAPDDPRVGFLAPEDQSYPLPLLRLAALFDSQHAPDLIVDRWPWTHGPGGSHGGLSLLQSRATLAFSGRGVVPGVFQTEARQVDVLPTVLAALGAPTTAGLGPDGTYDDGLYLLRQDGRVLHEVLDPCDPPSHVLIMLFDGLMPQEVARQTLADQPDVDLPTLRALVQAGAIFEAGSIVGFPTMSAAGHLTVGTGQWSGHHGIISNSVYDRASRTMIDPIARFSDPRRIAEDPTEVLAAWEVAVFDGTETVAQAAHRAFGPWDPETGTGAFVAVMNEPSFVGADASTFTTLTGVGTAADLTFYGLADSLAALQMTSLLAETDVPVPTIAYLSFVKTDGAGEAEGPHSPLLREVVAETDYFVDDILDAYDDRAALEDTMVVLVSDHGMELQDPTRTHGLDAAVAGSGVKVIETTIGIFHLRTLEVEASLDGAADVLSVTVRDHDDGQPVSGVTVSCDACEGDVLTAEDGTATLTASGPATVSASHPGYNPQTHSVN